MSKSCYVFIDASNMFYGSPNDLNWRIDYKKLIEHLKQRYNAKKVFYYSGIEVAGYDLGCSPTSQFPIDKLVSYLENLYKMGKATEKPYLLKYLKRAKFFRKLQEFGYILRLKPIKRIRTKEGGVKYKANCDVDLTFDMMRLEKEYSSFILFSGDGDFEVLLKYFKIKEKEFIIYSHRNKTARVIKEKYHKEYMDFSRLKKYISWE